MVYAPKSRFEIGIMDTRVEQGVQNVLALMNRVGTKHTTGNGMLILLCHTQLEAGVGYNILD